MIILIEIVLFVAEVFLAWVIATLVSDAKRTLAEIRKERRGTPIR